jgi:ADP-ribose pyrophosphatase
MKPWQTLSKRIVLNLGRFLAVEEHTVRLPDGRVIPNWPWVITPDYVIVVAVAEGGHFVCFRQYKYAIGETSLAPVGGYLESDENPLAGAKRELLEETGHKAAEWVAMGHYPVDGNRGAGIAHLFLALEARLVTEIRADDLEEQEILLLSHRQVREALLNGEFKLLPWAAAVSLALQHLDERGQVG